jgi:hypothetical protein
MKQAEEHGQAFFVKTQSNSSTANDDDNEDIDQKGFADATDLLKSTSIPQVEPFASVITPSISSSTVVKVMHIIDCCLV